MIYHNHLMINARFIATNSDTDEQSIKKILGILKEEHLSGPHFLPNNEFVPCNFKCQKYFMANLGLIDNTSDDFKIVDVNI